MPKPEMMFVQLKEEYDTKEKVEKVAAKWTQLLITNGLKIRPYPIDDNRLLFVVDTGMYDTEEFKKFALDQEETKVFEHKSQKYYPGQDNNNGVPDMAKLQEILAKQGISLGNEQQKKRRKKQGKTKRQKREEKKKRKEQKAMKKQEDGENTPSHGEKEEL